MKKPSQRHLSKNSSSLFVITTGDPAGCGPYITVQALNRLKFFQRIRPVVVGDRVVLEKIKGFDRCISFINLVDVRVPGIRKVKKGRISKIAGEASFLYLKEGLKIIDREGGGVLVTAPVSKEAISIVSPAFSGHTEFLARHYRVQKFAMMMVSKKVRIVLVTRHIPLRDVPQAITSSVLKDTINLVYKFLKEKFSIAHPRIVCASLNPHAGIDTFLDKEERRILSAIRKLKHHVYGPYPADTLFIPERLKEYDCVIALYHDQAMVPFKLLSFKDGVNLTVGLPIIRTSPAHGVAFDLMRNNREPSSSSMISACKLAYRISER